MSEKFSLTINEVANYCIFDDFKYAGHKKDINVKEEFDKVIEAYSYDGFVLSERNTSYYNHYIQLPELAAQPLQKHTYLNYIGEHYDGVKIEKTPLPELPFRSDEEKMYEEEIYKKELEERKRKEEWWKRHPVRFFIRRWLDKHFSPIDY